MHPPGRNESRLHAAEKENPAAEIRKRDPPPQSATIDYFLFYATLTR